MKRVERATSYPYGHLLMDLKSDTAEEDTLHTDIFTTAKPMDEKWLKTKKEEEEEEED